MLTVSQDKTTLLQLLVLSLLHGQHTCDEDSCVLMSLIQRQRNLHFYCFHVSLIALILLCFVPNH